MTDPELHVVIGAGPVGLATVQALLARSHRVALVTRSGTPPPSETGASVRAVAADATDAAAVRRALGESPAVIYNCASPPYTDWPQEWPALGHGLCDLAAATGAALVLAGNLYAYGPVDGPITESLPLAASGPKGQTRAAVWQTALARHQAGELTVCEVRASDLFGPGAGEGTHFGRITPGLLAGRPVRVLGNPDTPHSWTYIPDFAAALVTAGSDPRALGRAWHVPCPPAASQRELADELCRVAGLPTPRVDAVAPWMLALGRPFSPMLRELRETEYQFSAPWVVDAREAETVLGLASTNLEVALAATAS
jgi:nucleoside-diphosphate-sugar epimerase